MSDLLRFTTRKPAELTVADLARAYLLYLTARRSPATVAGAKSALAELARCFPGPLRTLTRDTLEAWHRGHPHPVRANRAVSYLRAAWKRAEEAGGLAEGTNPVTSFDSWKAAEAPRTVTLPPEALTLVLREIASQREAAPAGAAFRLAPVLLILLTGMRRGEVEALTWAEVRLGAGQPHLALAGGKTGARLVGLSAEAIELLRHIEPAGRAPEAKVFAGIDLRRAWEALRRLAGCPGVTLHDCRRSFAVRLLQSGAVDLSEIAKQLGHKSTRITAGVYTPMEISRATELANKAAGAILSAKP